MPGMASAKAAPVPTAKPANNIALRITFFISVTLGLRDAIIEVCRRPASPAYGVPGNRIWHGGPPLRLASLGYLSPSKGERKGARHCGRRFLSPVERGRGGSRSEPEW